jgi:glycosyltransferase involved in cell wall biosynthesis
MGQRVKLSAVIITLNEERNIRRCLRSLRPVADEIVVVDSLSTDRTREICQFWDVRFIEHPFVDYPTQKRFATGQATHRHVLSLDADESLSPRLASCTLEAKADWTADGFTMNRRNNYYGTWFRHSGLYPDRKLRLWDREKGDWQGAYVHEKVIMQPGATVGHLEGDLLHHAYGSIEAHVRQANRFSTLAAMAYRERGKPSNLPRVLLHPAYRFVRDYVVRLGFLDGYHGLLACTVNAYMTFLKYAKLRRLRRRADEESRALDTLRAPAEDGSRRTAKVE